MTTASAPRALRAPGTIALALANVRITWFFWLISVGIAVFNAIMYIIANQLSAGSVRPTVVLAASLSNFMFSWFIIFLAGGIVAPMTVALDALSGAGLKRQYAAQWLSVAIHGIPAIILWAATALVTRVTPFLEVSTDDGFTLSYAATATGTAMTWQALLFVTLVCILMSAIGQAIGHAFRHHAVFGACAIVGGLLLLPAMVSLIARGLPWLPIIAGATVIAVVVLSLYAMTGPVRKVG